nr:MAG TPA: hypothetical protein [Crassvirales sp.]
MYPLPIFKPLLLTLSLGVLNVSNTLSSNPAGVLSFLKSLKSYNL